MAEVESTCPVTGTTIRLTVGSQGVEAASPQSTVVSFVTPEQAKIQENVVRHFCHYVHFFSSAAVAEDWLSKHPGTRLLALDEAWALGRDKNATQHGGVPELGRLD